MPLEYWLAGAIMMSLYAAFMKYDASLAKKPPPKKPTALAAKQAVPESTTDAPRGKLGAIVAAVSAEAGATLEELVALTRWQAHTARAALTRLRQRGFAVHLANRDGRKAYRLDARP